MNYSIRQHQYPTEFELNNETNISFKPSNEYSRPYNGNSYLNDSSRPRLPQNFGSIENFIPEKIKYDSHRRLSYAKYQEQQQEQQPRYQKVRFANIRRNTCYENFDSACLQAELGRTFDYDQGADVYYGNDTENDRNLQHDKRNKKPLEKDYHNSLSAASCIANEMNYMNLYPNTSESTSISSIESTSGGGKVLNSNLSGKFKSKNPKPNSLSSKSSSSLMNKLHNSVKIKIHKLSNNNQNQTVPELLQKSSSRIINMNDRTINTNNSNDDEYYVQKQYKVNSTHPPLPSTAQSMWQTNSNPFVDGFLMVSLANFSHFDIQSVFFSYSATKSIITTLHTSLNIKTGASAASRQSSIENLSKRFASSTSLLPSKILNSRLTAYLKTSNDSSISSYDLTRNDRPMSLNYFDDEELSDQSKIKNEKNNKDMRIIISNSNINSDLVENCPCFRVEIGGDAFKGLGLVQDVSQRRIMKLNSISILDGISSYYKKEIIDLIEANNNEPFTIEYQDWGAYFYRHFFSNYDHSNYIGIDGNIGPVAISIRREKLLIESNFKSNYNQSEIVSEKDYVYRFIMRTSDVKIKFSMQIFLEINALIL